MTLPATRVKRPRATSGMADLSRALDDRMLAVVSACYTLLLVTIAAPNRGLAWDEAIYFSQVDPRSPAAFFSAPRSRGVTLIGAPVALFTSDPLAIRLFLAAAAGFALYASFAVWRRLVGGGTTALAALLFGTLWVSIDYGPQMMPDLWVAFGAVAAVGCFLRAAEEGPRPGCLTGLTCAVGWSALVRAPDGVFVALPLLLAMAPVRAWRRLATGLAIVGGLTAGLAEWVIEAYVRFGGITERLADSARIEGGMGLTWNVGNALRSANGPLLCRPCARGVGTPLLDAWWLAIPVLSAVALIVAARAGRGHLAIAALPMTCALSLSASYLFLLSYSAPRFFLPAYALLALPIGALMTRSWESARSRPTPWRVSAAALVASLLVVNVVTQSLIAHHQAGTSARVAARYRALAAALHGIGIRPPCLVAGDTQPIAYDAGCSSSLAADLRTDASPASGPDVMRAARHEAVAILVKPGERAPTYALRWTRHALSGPGLATGWSAYLPKKGH